MTFKIMVLGLSRPFFMLEWEKTKHKLFRTDLRSRLYRVQMPEVDKEIVKVTQCYMERLQPSLVLLDGSPASLKMQICSPEAAEKYVEKDYVGVDEDFRAEMARELGHDVVYLDEGFEKINRCYHSQKECIETVFMIDEMIKQSVEKEDYAFKTLEDFVRPEGSGSKDLRLFSEQFDRYCAIDELVKAKTSSLWVRGRDGFPIRERFEIEIHEHDRPIYSLLKDQKDLKKMDALGLEARTEDGREDYWFKKSEEQILKLPGNSQVMFIIEARYMGFDENSISFDPYREFGLPEDGLFDCGLKGCHALPVGHFHERLRTLGKVEVVNLTHDAMKKTLKNNWKI